MPRNDQLTNLAANAQADALAALLDAGYLRLYDGAQPATGDTPITTQVLLAELRFDTPAFGAAVGGVVTTAPMTEEASAPADGDATWFRAFQADGTTAVFDGNVGTTDENCVLNSVTIALGATVQISSLTYTAEKSA